MTNSKAVEVYKDALKILNYSIQIWLGYCGYAVQRSFDHISIPILFDHQSIRKYALIITTPSKYIHIELVFSLLTAAFVLYLFIIST